MDGDGGKGRPKQKRCAGKASKGAEKQAEMATVSDEPSHLSPSLTLSFLPPHKQAQQSLQSHTSSPSVSSPAGATAHGMVHGTQGMERLVAFGSCVGEGEGKEGMAARGTARAVPMASHG